MSKKTSKRRNQKLYKMKGCSKKTRKNYLGGSDAHLAYTGIDTPSQSNPFLSYTGKGGSTCGLSNVGNISQNINAANPAIPNTGPPILPRGTPIWNQASTQKGGVCGACLMSGGKTRHRIGCRCSKCKKNHMKGGNSLIGSPYNPGNVGEWPGVDGIPGDRNYISQNMYLQDPQTAMKNTGEPPFLGGGRKRRQKGGFIGHDLINLGRQFQFGLGSAYNALAGYSAPVNPMPWKGQLEHRTPLNRAIL